MKYYSTRDRNISLSAKVATSKGLASDSGLFMPEFIPQLPDDFFSSLKGMSFNEIALEVSKLFFSEEIDEAVLDDLVRDAYDFPCPLQQLDNDLFVLELFHGPTFAFKDYGARFLARIMSCYRQKEDRVLDVLVATSGDTGSAVASGFYKVPGIRVTILYPTNKISPLQELQLTTLGENIRALEIQGTFDDCQGLVKEAFLDVELNQTLDLTSANSINIGRFIPQSFYYFYAVSKLRKSYENVVFSVPSGNLGNLTAGFFAKRMGLNIKGFISALNANNVFEEYLSSGTFTPRASVQTIANAMDVGNPSNLERIINLYEGDVEAMRNDIKAVSFQDQQIEECIREVDTEYDYLLCPHSAAGFLGLAKYRGDYPNSAGIVLATAHPAKFIDKVDPLVGGKTEIPSELALVMDKKKESVLMDNQYETFKSYLLSS